MVRQTLEQALAHHGAGRLAEAEALYKNVLRAQPGNADALHLLGVLATQAGRAATAMDLIGMAIKSNPAAAAYHFNLGAACAAAGETSKAAKAYRKAISLDHDFAQAHASLGMLLADGGKLEDAARSLGRALQIDPGLASAHNNLGNLLCRLEQLDRAVASYQQALSAKPDYAEALANLGNAQRLNGRLEDAEAACRRAVELDPNFAAAHANLGQTLWDQDKLSGAEEAFERALRIDPKLFEAWVTLGLVLQAAGKLEGAIKCFSAALGLRAEDAVVLGLLGGVHRDLKQFEEAEKFYRRALARDGKPAAAHLGVLCDLAATLRERHHLAESAAAYLSALEIEADFAPAIAGLADTRVEQGLVAEAVEGYRRALEIDPADRNAHAALLLALHYRDQPGPAAMRREAETWAARHTAEIVASENHQNDPDPARRLRVGYVSADFRRHSVAYFAEALFAAREPGAVETFAFYNSRQRDAVTEKFITLADHWHEVAGLTDAGLAELIRAREIDILVDLSGHTSGNRLATFAARPAPLQISYMGYPGSSGLDAIASRIGDEHVDPTGQADAYCTETVVRLADCFLCFKPPGEAPAPAAGLRGGGPGVTFGCFNHLPKLAPGLIQTWAEILSALPRARLILKNQSLECGQTRARLAADFGGLGVASGRLELLGMIPGLDGHLGLYNSIDVALDSFPYNGTTTTCEALWMGVPVITLAGGHHAARVGASLLYNVNLGDLVADTRSQYLDLAVALAGDPGRRQHLHSGLRRRMTRSPLVDAGRFSRALESAYRDLWRRWCGR